MWTDFVFIVKTQIRIDDTLGQHDVIEFVVVFGVQIKFFHELPGTTTMSADNNTVFKTLSSKSVKSNHPTVLAYCFVVRITVLETSY